MSSDPSSSSSADRPKDPRDALFDVAHLKEGLGARTGRGAVTVLMFSGAKLGLTLLTTAILARLIAPDQHGLLAMAIPAVLVATGLSEFGLAQAVTQRREVTHRLASGLFWVNLALGAALTGIVFALAGPAARFYDTPEVVWVFQGLSAYVVLGVLTTQYMALLRRQMRIAQIEWASTGAAVVSAAGAVALALAGYGVEALMAQLLLQQVLTMVGLVWLTGWRPSGPRSLGDEAMGEALRYGSWLAAERVLNDLSRNLFLTLVGRQFGQVEAGLYYRADTIAQMPQRRVLSPLSAAFIPALSRLQDDVQGLRAMVRRQIVNANLIVVPVGAAVAGLSDVVVEILLGPDWRGAAPVLALLGAYIATGAAQSCLAWAMVATGQSRALFWFRAVNILLIIAVVAVAMRFDMGLVGLTACYVAVVAGLTPLHCGIWAARATPLTGRDIATILAETYGVAVVFFAAVLGVRFFFELSMWAEGGMVVICLAVLFALTIALRPGPRRDIAKLLGGRR